jgi:hypothetical protein
MTGLTRWEGIFDFEFLILNVGLGGRENGRLMNVDF